MRRIGPLVAPELVQARARKRDDAAASPAPSDAPPPEAQDELPAPDTNLVARVLALQQRAELEARTRPTIPDPDARTPGPLVAPGPRRTPRVQLPLWSDHHRPVLHDLVRSALFTCRQKEARLDFKHSLVHSVDNVKITYTGQELRQRDLDVYLQVLHVARGMVADDGEEWIDFDARSLVKELRWTQNKRSLAELRDAVRRMQACGLEVTSRRDKGPAMIYGGPLVLEYAGVGGEFDEVVRWRVRLNPRIAAMFRPGNYARINWDARAKLSPLGKWLQAFYSTNVQPFPMKVETLRRLSGSNASALRTFRGVLREALADLVATGVLHTWRIDNDDKVHVEREAPNALPAASGTESA